MSECLVSPGSATVQVAKRAAHITNSAGKKNVTRSRMLQKTRQESAPTSGSNQMPKEALLSKPQASIIVKPQVSIIVKSRVSINLKPQVNIIVK